MNLTDRQRKLLFVGLVVALAAVGIYLTMNAPDDDPADGAASRPPASAPPSAGPAGPASPPPGITSTVTPGNFDIYRLLPFSQRDFAAAADIAQRFVAAQGTYRFDEDPKVFVGRLTGLVTDQLRAEIERGASSPGLQDERRQEQTVAVSTATLDRVRDIEDNSIIFLVTGKQDLTEAGKKRIVSEQWAVTVARDGGALKVYAFEPSDQGQQGDTGGTG